MTSLRAAFGSRQPIAKFFEDARYSAALNRPESPPVARGRHRRAAAHRREAHPVRGRRPEPSQRVEMQLRAVALMRGEAIARMLGLEPAHQRHREIPSPRSRPPRWRANSASPPMMACACTGKLRRVVAVDQGDARAARQARRSPCAWRASVAWRMLIRSISAALTAAMLTSAQSRICRRRSRDFARV